MRLDYSLKTFEERCEFAERVHETMRLSNSDKRILNDYVLRAHDVPSGRQSEYSYYRDENRFRKSSSGNGNIYTVDFNNKRNRDILDQEARNNREAIVMITENDIDLANANLIELLRLKEHYDLKNVTFELGDLFKYVYEAYLKSVKDKTDYKIIKLLTKDLTYQEVGEQLNLHYSTVGRRVSTMTRKAKHILLKEFYL